MFSGSLVISGKVRCRPPAWVMAATSRPPALATSAVPPASAMAWVISMVPRSTPPVTSEGRTWRTTGGLGIAAGYTMGRSGSGVPGLLPRVLPRRQPGRRCAPLLAASRCAGALLGRQIVAEHPVARRHLVEPHHASPRPVNGHGSTPDPSLPKGVQGLGLWRAGCPPAAACRTRTAAPWRR